MENNTVDAITKGSRRIMRKIIVKPENTIKTYKDGDLWHCDVEIHHDSNPVYRYGAVRHNKTDINDYSNRQICVNSVRGIKLKTVK